MLTIAGRIVPGTLLFLGLAAVYVLLGRAVLDSQWLVVAGLIAAPLFVLLVFQYQEAMMMFWLAGLATIFIYPNNMLASIPGATVERLLFVAFFGMFLLRLALEKDRPWRPIAVEKAIFLLLGICLASLLYHLPDRSDAARIEDVLLFFRGLMMPMLTLMLVRDRHWPDSRIRNLIWAMIAAGLYLAICGYLQFFMGADFFRPAYLEKMIHLERVTGTFANAIEYGSFVGTILILTLYQFRQTRSAPVRIFLVVTLLVLGGAIVLAQGRAVWLGLAVTLCLIVVADRQARSTVAALVGVMIVGLVVFLMATANTTVSTRLTERLNEQSPVLNRITVYATAINMISDKPLFGFGFGRFTFHDEKREYVTSFGSVSPQYAMGVGLPHNEFLHIGVLTGLVGLGAYALVIACAFLLILPERRPTGPPDEFVTNFRPYLGGILVLVLLNAQFADLMWFTGFMVLAYFMLGVYASRKTEARTATAPYAANGIVGTATP